MWFVILKTLPPLKGAGSLQPEMLLVADDANAAYSNPRPLPKCAQTLLPCISLLYRTARCPPDHRKGRAQGRFRRCTFETQKIHLAVSQLVLTLTSVVWDTEVKTSPPHRGPGGAKRLGTRRLMTIRQLTARARATDQTRATPSRVRRPTD